MLDAGFVKTPAEADKKIEQVWTEKYPKNHREIMPSKQQEVIPHYVERKINYEMMQRQKELKIKQQEKITTTLSKMGIVFENKTVGVNTSLIAKEIAAPIMVEQNKPKEQDEETELLFQYLEWKRKTKDMENGKKKIIFAEDKQARVARENLALKTVVTMFTGRLLEAPHIKDMVTGEQIAANLPTTAPLEAKSQIVKMRNQDDGSYFDWLNIISKLGELTSRGEAINKMTSAIDASRPVEATFHEKGSQVSGFEVWKVLFGKRGGSDSEQTGFSLAA